MTSATLKQSPRKPLNKLFKVIILLTVVSVAAPLLLDSLVNSLSVLVKGLLAGLVAGWEDASKHPKIFSDADSIFLNDMVNKKPPPVPATTTTTKATTTTTEASAGSTPTTTTTTSAPPTPSYPPNVRLEFRLMTKQQWREFIEAVQYVMTHNAPNHQESMYDTYVGFHRNTLAPCAHNGAGFLTWHCLYGHSFDSALREYNPSVTVPMFDTRLDTEIPNHCDACQFTPEMLGNNNGVVTTGPMANRKVYPADCASTPNGPILKRACNPDYKALLIDYNEYANFISSYNTYHDFCKESDAAFEDSHNTIHVCMGGHLNDLSCSSNDVLFWLIHHFVHSIYETTMDKYSQEAQQQMSYPTDSDITVNHKSTDQAKPFTITLGEAFKQCTARNMTFITVPANCDTDAQCNPTNSDMNAIWCKSQSRRCAAKIRIGGKCSDDKLPRYPDKACYKESFCKADPTCTGGVCVCAR